MTFDPHNDGNDHINIYSQGKTELGRFLSNFAHTPFECPDGKFASVEGYWYWLSCTHERREELRSAYGFYAKKLGRELRTDDWNDTLDFKDRIRNAISIKLTLYPRLTKMFYESTLPFVHYYMFGSKQQVDSRSDWIIEHITTCRTSREHS